MNTVATYNYIKNGNFPQGKYCFEATNSYVQNSLGDKALLLMKFLDCDFMPYYCKMWLTNHFSLK